MHPKVTPPFNRTFKRFNKDIFLFDISCAPFSNVYNFSNPDDVMLAWYDIFMPIIDKHALLRKKRVKRPKLFPWLTKDVIGAMAIRDRLKKEKKSLMILKSRETE